MWREANPFELGFEVRRIWQFSSARDKSLRMREKAKGDGDIFETLTVGRAGQRTQVLEITIWRGDRAVEGARLEIVCTPNKGTEGSNPSLSAIFTYVKYHLIVSPLSVCTGKIASPLALKNALLYRNCAGFLKPSSLVESLFSTLLAYCIPALAASPDANRRHR